MAKCLGGKTSDVAKCLGGVINWGVVQCHDSQKLRLLKVAVELCLGAFMSGWYCVAVVQSLMEIRRVS